MRIPRAIKFFHLFIFLIVTSCVQENAHENKGDLTSEKLNDTIEELVTNPSDSSNYLSYKGSNPCAEKINYDTISDPELKKIYIYLDTIGSILNRRPNYETWGNTWPSEEENIQFENMTEQVDSLLYLFLNNKNSLKINLSCYFNVISSPDDLVRLITYGSANIGGTGRYYKNFIQIIDHEKPVARLWDDMNYESIDTLSIGSKTIYLFSSKTRWMTWWMAFKLKAYEKEGEELKPYKNLFLNNSDEILVDYDVMSDGSDDFSEQESIGYINTKREIVFHLEQVRVYKPDSLSNYLFDIVENNDKDIRKIGSLNIRLKFNGKYFEIKQ